MYYFLDKIVFEAGEVKSETAVIDYNLLNLHDVLTNPYDNDLNKKKGLENGKEKHKYKNKRCGWN